VKDVFQYLSENGFENILLFGTSMGAVAIMKAISDYDIHPESVILESPFGSMYKTVCSRFRMNGLPTFPMAGLLVFWGGVQNGFSGFSHNPEDYARKIKCPVLLLYGEKDDRVTRKEIDQIFQNLNGQKTLVTYPLAGHENFLLKYKEKWTQDVNDLLSKN
jgi:alpha-beta hydrolase superfamily lysophospholipase